MRKNVVITGGAGYIGSMLAAELSSLGHQVTIVDKFNFGTSSINHLVSRPNFDVIQSDVCDLENYTNVLKTCDVFVPLAALVGAPLCAKFPSETERVNTGAILRALDLIKQSCFVIYPNTNSGYGITSGEKLCTEDMPLNPVSIYGETKVKTESSIIDRGNSAVFRLATVFGASNRPRFDLIVKYFVRQAVLEKNILVFQGDMKRNFVHVLDVVDAFIYAINNHITLDGEIFNLGNDNENASKIETATKISLALEGVNIIEGSGYVDPDKRNYIVSNKKLMDFGFSALRSIEDEVPILAKQVKLALLSNANY